MVKDIRKGRFTYPGAPDIATPWAYLPDLARTFVAVAQRRAELPAFEVLHFAGHRITGQCWLEVLGAIAQAHGRATAVGRLTRLTGWAGAAAETFWRDQVEGCQPLPLEDQLQQFGVRLKTEHKGGTLGLKLSEAHGVITVQQVLRDSPAARAGVSAHDQIIAVDGMRATQTLLQKLNQAATRPVCLQVFRRDELLALSLQPQEVRLPVARLEVTDEAALAGWLADGAGRTAP